ncbi:2'-5' RNA ligase family protein [Algoriphagus limi]|uniref:2'-5' RNA ligase family protein n=1 Tax=Algoriphagus limi TaxID=2975273 RepID=A0ABT2G9N8_9BACT|nr:2'-5' RNA ligase family protein [Algoriphagus limi]MCS5491151.1 2'-5' RNA ligase family protein [Algoriphagus limi]
MTQLQKYFLAILPPPDFLQQVHELKLKLREEFGIKYALKSPPHITIRMPFLYNELKEDRMVGLLNSFAANIGPFPLEVKGTDQFRGRVIFLDIHAGDELFEMQKALRIFCKRNLNLKDELSDLSFHPHMTVAFRDVKKLQFDSVFKRVKEQGLEAKFEVNGFFLLKHQNGVWTPKTEILLKN